MPTSPALTEVRRGRIERIRFSAPVYDGRYALHMAGEILHGRIDTTPQSAYGLRALCIMAELGLPTTLGLRVHGDGRREVQWAVAAGTSHLVPTRGHALRSDAIVGLTRWCPALLLCTAIAASLLPHAHKSFLWFFPLLIAAIAAGVAAFACFEHARDLWRIRRDRATFEAGECAFEDALREARRQRTVAQRARRTGKATPRGRNDDDDDVERTSPVPTTRNEATALRRLHGRLAYLEVGSVWGGTGSGELQFAEYRFRLGSRRHRFLALRGLGYVEPFLAEGDRVELIAHGDEGDATPVYAIRNLEDRRTYVAHGIFRLPGQGPAITGYTARRYWRRAAAGLAVMLPVFALLYGTELMAPDGDFLLLHWVCGGLAFGFLAMLVGPYECARWRWVIGRPDPAQALTSRLYAAFDLGSPFDRRLPEGVDDV